jgi:hypothetical protein
VRREAFTIAFFAIAACARRVDTSNGYAAPQAEARTYYYTDEGGLRVFTVGAQGSANVSQSVRVTAQALADRVLLNPPTPVQPQPPGPGQPSGHYDPGVDVISSASVNSSNEPARIQKWRFEGIAGGTWSNQSSTEPLRLGLLVRGSTEPDYRSLYARAFGEIELFARNTTLSGFVGYGHDAIIPKEAPPGQESLWPAHHDRVNGGGTLSQILSRELVGSIGLGFTYQWGTLSSPYRRALVQTTLFPEVLPTSRARLTGFAGLSWYLGGDTALHLREGFYVDSWHVLAVIPEALLAKELGRNGLVSFRYRFYGQGHADFYHPVYPEIRSILAGDPRLGELREHLGGIELRWAILGRMGWADSLVAIGGYELSILSYRQLHSSVRAQVFSLGLTWGY